MPWAFHRSTINSPIEVVHYSSVQFFNYLTIMALGSKLVDLLIQFKYDK